MFENYTACLELEDQRVELSLWDTSGEDNIEILTWLWAPLSPLSFKTLSLRVRSAFVSQYQDFIHGKVVVRRTCLPSLHSQPGVESQLERLLLSQCFTKTALLLFALTLFAYPALMKISSFSLVSNLLGDLSLWIKTVITILIGLTTGGSKPTHLLNLDKIIICIYKIKSNALNDLNNNCQLV